MTMLLTPVEARVLGALVEKQVTTPEYYPLSLNALVNACNQKNNREPVMMLDETEVRRALHALETERLARPARGEGRVPKFEHNMQEVFNFTRGEMAVMCVLLLRGPQTPGELRGRSERMHPFEELSDVQTVLQKLMTRDPALVKVLPRQHGMKEVRYVHLLSGDVEGGELFPPSAVTTPVAVGSEWFAAPSTAFAGQQPGRFAPQPQMERPVAPILTEEDMDLQERVTQMEAEVAVLTRELLELRGQVERLLKKPGKAE
jgi:uncharacterized protein YceH (UPF0502 family)